MRALYLLLGLCVLAALNPGQAGEYPAAVHYRQTVTGIVREAQLGQNQWPLDKPDARRYLGRIVVSANAARVAFFVYAPWLNSTYWHLYVVDSNGQNLRDLTPNMPEYWLAYLDINNDGSRVFFGRGDLYYCDLPGGQCHPALNQATWYEDFREPFGIDRYGDRLFFRHDAGWDEAAQKVQEGIYTASLGGAPRLLMHIDRLPCQSAECGNMNLLSFLGASTDGQSVLIGWNRNYRSGMWHIDSSGTPRLLGDEHKYIWLDHGSVNRILSEDGNIALYEYKHDDGMPNRLLAYDLRDDSQTFIAETYDLNGYGALTLSPTGSHAFLRGQAHDGTLVDLQSGAKRDTNSYFVNDDHEAHHSNLTANNRYYFMGGGGHYTETRLMRVDMAPVAYPAAPQIVAVSFSAPALLDAEGSTVGIEVQVRDAQGLGNIEWVNLSTLVAGKETPDWPMGRGPLAFPSGDTSSTRLFDDGSHGDRVAGDGIYSFDAMATRKGSRDLDGVWNTWYAHHALPHAVEIRLIAKDKDDNYSIADTELLITDDPAVIAPATAAVLRENWDVRLQPVEVFGDYLDVLLRWYVHPQNPPGMYWQLGEYASSASREPAGAHLLTDWRVQLTPVDVFGVLYDVELEFYRNPLDPFGFYWRLSKATLH
jgi:hypothetical protein